MHTADSSAGWRLSFAVPRAVAEAFAGEHPALVALDPMPALVASEGDDDGWQLDAYFTEPPAADAVGTIEAAVGAAGTLSAFESRDWVTESQRGLEPVTAGRFRIRSERDAPMPGATELVIEASRAFGTGHHATTRGCLIALDDLHGAGVRARRIADIGTGTGVLAFAAHRLWPAAQILASDIDAEAVAMLRRFAATNAISCGRGPGRVEPLAAAGTAHRRIAAAAPFDLVIANILAGPLIALACDLARIAAPGGRLILAGLIADQRAGVAAAYRAAGFRLDDPGEGEWPTLRLTRRARFGHRRPARTPAQRRQPAGDTGEW
jgi:ribosomal protein L11 methyltransferase